VLKSKIFSKIESVIESEALETPGSLDCLKKWLQYTKLRK